MKKSLAAGLALVALVVATVVATGATAAPAKTQAGTLTGAGATFPFPLISKWIPEVGKAYDINITYSPTGSGAGIAAITARTVDFGASDAPLSSSQLDACKGCVVIPWALSATSIPYNLPGLNGRLRLTGPVLAQIYLGEITNWNDQRIRALNPGRNLPDTKITPVFRSDGSGTTYNFTEYLSSVSPTWKDKVGVNTSVSFPTGVGARGSSGVAGVVRNTPGALTYVDVAYSLANKFEFALDAEPGRQVRDAGPSRHPGLRSRSCRSKVTSLNQLKIVDPPRAAGPLAYPIVTFTYVIAPTQSEQGGRPPQVHLLGGDAGPEVRPAAPLPAAAGARCRRSPTARSRRSRARRSHEPAHLHDDRPTRSRGSPSRAWRAAGSGWATSLFRGRRRRRRCRDDDPARPDRLQGGRAGLAGDRALRAQLHLDRGVGSRRRRLRGADLHLRHGGHVC